MSQTISGRFAELKEEGTKALVVFFTAGDQPLSEMADIIAALEEGGADLIEVGIPFSDPYGEGRTIQAASERSLANGTTPRAIIDELSNIRAGVPFVTMGYYNPILRFGIEAYAAALAEAGAAGAIIQDLIPEEAGEWEAACARHDLETIFLAAPTSTENRIEEVARRTTGFVYAISRTGVTGAESEISSESGELVRKLRGLSARPICVGFGISRPEHVRMVCGFADGAVVGSSLVSLLHEKWGTAAGRAAVVDYVRSLKEATK
jgi:tryptophan synthase alpha chain